MSIALNNDNVDALTLNIMDSMTVNLTTMVMPNIPTSGPGALLLGKYTRPDIGNLSSSPYFRIVPSDYDYSSIPTGARFDSVRLELRTHNSGYYYGDTTSQHRISVHRLTQPLEATTLVPGGIHNVLVPIYVEGPAIFGHQEFAYETSPLGELVYHPRPRGLQHLSVRLDDSFGQDIFDKMRNNALEVSSASNFVDYIKGVAIIPDTDNTSLIAYNDTIATHIHYSYIGSDGLRQSESKRLVIDNYDLKFNHFEVDRAGTPFEGLTIENPIPAQQTGGQSFLQAGSGTATRIDIPALTEFLYASDIAINKVELEIEMANSNDLLFPLPTGQSTPMLFIANRSGNIQDFVKIPFSMNPQSAVYVPGNNTGRNARYVFNLIEYIRTVNDPNMLENFLVLTMGPPTLFTTANLAIIATENNKPKIKLNILYTKFK